MAGVSDTLVLFLIVPHSSLPVSFSKTAREGRLEFEKVKTKSISSTATHKH